MKLTIGVVAGVDEVGVLQLGHLADCPVRVIPGDDQREMAHILGPECHLRIKNIISIYMPPSQVDYTGYCYNSAINRR